MGEELSKVYIKTDENILTNLNGGYSMPEPVGEGWVFWDEGEGDRYNLCRTHYLPESITTDEGEYRYQVDFEKHLIFERGDEDVLT